MSAVAVKIFAALLGVFVVSSALAADPLTEEILACRKELPGQKKAVLVDWSTRPLPNEYRQPAKWALLDTVVIGWTTHTNSNQSLTIVIRTLDPETGDVGFALLFKSGSRTSMTSVHAYEFAFSSREHNGVTGLFFCDRHGPSGEWVRNGNNWKVMR